MVGAIGVLLNPREFAILPSVKVTLCIYFYNTIGTKIFYNYLYKFFRHLTFVPLS